MYFLAITFCYAQENSAGEKEFKNAINIGFVGIQTTSLSINYERLMGGNNGIVIGMPILNFYDSKERGLSLNYRRHFRGAMSSGFWGIFANYSLVENEVESTNESVKTEYKFSIKSFAIGPDIGFRWVDKSGINLALRIGYGIPFSYFTWKNEPTDKDLADDARFAFKIISGFDAELTLGYCF